MRTDYPSTDFDIVTVVYRAELNLMRAQARSISVMVPNQLPRQINVILNDDTSASDFSAEFAPLYGEHWAKVRVFNRKTIAPDLPDWGHGWRTQQILKILVANSITSSFYLVLDAKNHFVRPVTLADFFSDSGHVRSFAMSYRLDAFDHCSSSFSFFGLDPYRHIDRLPPSITPVLMDRSLVQEMASKFMDATNLSFEEGFLQVGSVTEFLLYYAYVILKNGEISSVIDFGEPQVATLFLDKVVDDNNFASIMWQIQQSTRYMFGIHSLALKELKREQKAQIIRFWAERGLCCDEEEALTWLSTRE